MKNMNLNNFESYIDKKILARGYDYYENGYVTSVEETEDNVYEAEVEGSELYTVEVELDDQANIVDTQCDCPYDMGKYCKHQVAVFLMLENRKKTYHDVYNRILIAEGEKQKLLEYVKERPSTIENFYKQLIPEFRKEVYTLFLQYIEQTAARASNRKVYHSKRRWGSFLNYREHVN